MADRALQFWDDTGEAFSEMVREWPAGVRKAIGADLRRVQRGEEPKNWKPLTGMPVAAREVRHDSGARVVYCVTYTNISGSVFIVDAFMKDSREGSEMRKNVRARIKRRLIEHKQKFSGSRKLH